MQRRSLVTYLTISYGRCRSVILHSSYLASART